MIKFLYQFLFVDQKTKTLSHSKFWSHIGYGVMCYTFTYAVIYGTTVDVTIWALFGICVLGNRALLKALDIKANTLNKGGDNADVQ